MTALEAARDSFRSIDGVASCHIGIEATISPADYPMIRIVPERLTPGRPYSNRTATCLVYFGMPIAESEGTDHTSGLEEIYRALFDLEAEILEKLRALEGRYIETIMDSDRIAAYKLAAVRCELRSTS
jgi:hypothetical protein